VDVIDEKDFVYAGINPILEMLTGVKAADIVGKPLTLCEII
jgi:hypothetical protein